MKRALIGTLGLLLIGGAAVWSPTASAQTTANGPYYATPSWDQTLPSPTRFIVLSNFESNAVLDRETGLVWERAPAASLHTWTAARSECCLLYTSPSPRDS